MTVKPIPGQPSSAQVRVDLQQSGAPILVGFSCGKDSIATVLALREAGVPDQLIHLVYLYGVPPKGGRLLDFLERDLAQLSDQLGLPIARYPHESLYRILNAKVFQPPAHDPVIVAADLPSPTSDQLWDMIREDLHLPADTWLAMGVRAADSIMRRIAFTKHGVWRPKHKTVFPVWDWQKAEVLDIMRRHQVELPIDYQWFQRSFDGFDYRFLEPIREHAPADYQRICEWIPLAPLELARHELEEARRG